MYRILILSSLLFFSCIKKQESIDPIAEPVSISESQTLMFNQITQESLGAQFVFENPDYYMFADDPDHFYLKVDYKFKDFSLEDLLEGPIQKVHSISLEIHLFDFLEKYFFHLVENIIWTLTRSP